MSEMLFESESEGLVDILLEELRDRRGVGHELRLIADDIYEEMVMSLIVKVNAYLETHFDEMLGKAPKHED